MLLWCFPFLQSCPPIQVYTPSNLDRGLDAAACNFVSQEVTVDKEARTVSACLLLALSSPP